MIDEAEEQLPGVTLYFKTSQVQTPVAKELFRVHLVLDAVVNDEETWKNVERQFIDGLRVYTTNTLTAEVMDRLRINLAEARQKVSDSQREYKQLQATRAAEEMELVQLRAWAKQLGKTFQR